MTQLRSARHSRYPSYFAPDGVPMPPRGRRKQNSYINCWATFGPLHGSNLGRSWTTAWLILGLYMAHRMAHSWTHLGPPCGSLLAIGREDGRYSRARGRRRTHGEADTGRSETDAASQHIIPAVIHDVTDNIKPISSIVCTLCSFFL